MFHFLQLFFFVVVVFLLNPHLLLVKSQPSGYYDCEFSSTRCPNGERIEYPFYNGEDPDNYEYDCGYPGLSAKCSEGGRPIITLSNHSYYYKYTPAYYQSYLGEVTLWDIDTADQICPQPRHNFSLEGPLASSFRMYEYAQNITFFYNCTTLPKDVSPNLPCIDNLYNYSGRSFAMLESSIPVGFKWYANCQHKVIVPVYDYFPEMNYTEAIKSGIWLRVQPTEDCQICEESGGSCSNYRNSSSFQHQTSHLFIVME